MPYTVQVLTNKEFDKLPYKHIKDALGLADKEKNMAFVRETGVKEWDIATLRHEIDELVAKVSPHEEDGIRYKSFKKWWRRNIERPIEAIFQPKKFAGTGAGRAASIVTPILLGALTGGLGLGAGVGGAGAGTWGAGTGALYGGWSASKRGGDPLLGAAMGGLGGWGGARLGTGAVAGGTAADPGFLSKAGGIIKGGLVGTPATAAAGATPGIIGSGGNLLGMGAGTAGRVGVTGATGTTLKGSLAATQPTTIQFGGQTSNILGGMRGLTAATPAAIAPTVSAVSPSFWGGLAKGAGDWLKKPQNILGLGMTGASMLPKAPAFPEVDYDAMINELRSGTGVTALGQQAQAELQRIMSMSPEELYPVGTDSYYTAVLRQTREAYGRAQDALAQRYNMIDPNYQQSGEYQEMSRRLDTELANIESDYAATEEQRRFELARTAKYQAVQDALQVDDAVMREISGLTGLSAQQAATKYAAQLSDIEAIRQALSDVGGRLLTGGFTEQT